MYGNMSMFGLIFSLMLLGTARCLPFPGDRGDLHQRYGVLEYRSSNAGRHLAFTLPSVCNYSCLKTEFSSDLSVCLSPMFYFMALLVFMPLPYPGFSAALSETRIIYLLSYYRPFQGLSTTQKLVSSVWKLSVVSCSHHDINVIH